MSKQRFLIKTGEHAGKIVEGQGCNARAYPTAPVDLSLGDGIWIHSLNLRIKQEYDQASGCTGCGNYVHYKDLVIPFDKNGNELFVGDKIYFSSKNCVCIGEIKKFGVEYHVGCGWMQRKMTVTDIHTKQTHTINVPVHTIKIEN